MSRPTKRQREKREKRERAREEFAARLAEYWRPTVEAATANHVSHTGVRVIDCLHCFPR